MPLWQMADGERAIVVSWVRGSGSVSHSAVLEPNEIVGRFPARRLGLQRQLRGTSSLWTGKRGHVSEKAEKLTLKPLISYSLHCSKVQ